MHGIVLLEGLKDGRLPDSLESFVEREYQHFLGGTHGVVRIARLVLKRSEAPSVAFELASCLQHRHYYARLNDEAVMFVAFPSAVVRISREDPQSAETARSIGAVFDVDRSHMEFEKMFELDHPEMHNYDGSAVPPKLS